MEIRAIAQAFSLGKFEEAYPYLAEDIVWEIVGENLFSGKKAVVQNCKQVADYFQSVTTHFKTSNVITERNKVAVNGSAEFFRNNILLSSVLACDIYEFNNQNHIEKITSYCIQIK